MTALLRAENNEILRAVPKQNPGEKSNRQIYGGTFIGPPVGGFKKQSEPA